MSAEDFKRSEHLNDMGLKEMSNEEYVETLILWDFTDGKGEVETEALQEFRETLNQYLNAAPKGHPCRQKLQKKIREVENIFRMTNEITEKISTLVEKDMK
jgi:hypothetical protein